MAALAIMKYDFQRFLSREMGLAHQEIDAFSPLDAALAAIAEAVHNIAFALAHFRHVDAYRPRMHAVVSAAPRQVSDARAGNHRLGGRTSLVNAGAANMHALDNSGLPSRVG